MLVRLTFFGAIYLAVLIILPAIFVNAFGINQRVSNAFGGTTILIVVGVALDTMRQMESQLVMRNYEGSSSSERSSVRCALKPAQRAKV